MQPLTIPIEVTLSQEAIEALARLLLSLHDEEKRAKASQPMTPKQRSEHANMGGQKPPAEMGLLIDSKDAAKMLSVCEKTLWSLAKRGDIPKPIRFGRAVRWPYDELRAWAAAGCPKRDEWERRCKEAASG